MPALNLPREIGEHIGRAAGYKPGDEVILIKGSVGVGQGTTARFIEKEESLSKSFGEDMIKLRLENEATVVVEAKATRLFECAECAHLDTVLEICDLWDEERYPQDPGCDDFVPHDRFE